MDTRTSEPRIPTVGGGYVGMYAAPPEGAAPRRGPVTVVDPRPNMTYQPFLPEAAAGYIEARRVVVPLRRALLLGREIVSLGHIEHPCLAGESAALAQTSIPHPWGGRTRVWQG